MADEHEIDANPNISCSHVKGRCDFLLIHRMAYHSVDEKNAHHGYAQEAFEAHDESQEAYNYHAQYSPYVLIFHPDTSSSGNCTKISKAIQTAKFGITTVIEYQQDSSLQALITVPNCASAGAIFEPWPTTTASSARSTASNPIAGHSVS